MPVLITIWLQFVCLALIISLAGYYLSVYGDMISEKTGIGGHWIGLVLIGSITSLPELATGSSAIIVSGVPDIAVGDALGSCVFNLLLLVMLDFLHRKESVYTRLSQGHILSGGFGVLLLGILAFNILLAQKAPKLAVAHIGVYSPFIFLLYFVAIRNIFHYEKNAREELHEDIIERYPQRRLREITPRFTLAGLAVIISGSFLPGVGMNLAMVMGWQQAFVGTLFVAFATSLPEVAVTIAALRIGALDMAMGDLLGSNLFDMFIVAIYDFIFVKGPILAHVSTTHAVTALSAIMMTGVGIIGLVYRPKHRLFKTVGWASLLLFSLYLMNTLVLYLYHN